MDAFDRAVSGREIGVSHEELRDTGEALEIAVLGVAVCLIASTPADSIPDQGIIDLVSKDFYDAALQVAGTYYGEAADELDEEPSDKDTADGESINFEEVYVQGAKRTWPVALMAVVHLTHDLDPQGYVADGIRIYDEEISEEDIPTLENVVDFTRQHLMPFIVNGTRRIESHLGYHQGSIEPESLFVAIMEAKKDGVNVTRDLKGWFQTYHDRVMDRQYAAGYRPELVRHLN